MLVCHLSGMQIKMELISRNMGFHLIQHVMCLRICLPLLNMMKSIQFVKIGFVL